MLLMRPAAEQTIMLVFRLIVWENIGAVKMPLIMIRVLVVRVTVSTVVTLTILSAGPDIDLKNIVCALGAIVVRYRVVLALLISIILILKCSRTLRMHR